MGKTYEELVEEYRQKKQNSSPKQDNYEQLVTKYQNKQLDKTIAERPKPTTLNLPSANPLRPIQPTGIMYNKPTVEEPRRTLIPKLISLIDKNAGSTAQAFENSLFNPLGLKTLIDKVVSKLTGNDKPYQEDRNLQEEHPVAGMVGKLSSDIAFGTPVFKTIGAGVTKALPFLGQATSIAAKGTMGALEGAGYGLLEGGIRGVNEDKGLRGTAEDALTTAKDYAMFGGLLGGAVGGIGKGLSKYKTNSGLSNIDNAYSKLSQDGISSFKPDNPIPLSQNRLTSTMLRPQQQPQATESILKPVNGRGNMNSPSKNIMPIEGQPQKSINQFREPTNMIEPTTPSKFDYIKTVDDLPNDIPSLEAYVNEVKSQQDSGMKMIDFKLQLFAEAEKKLALIRQQNKEAKLLADRQALNNKYQNVRDIPDTTSQLVEANKKDPVSLKQRVSNTYTALVDRFHPIKQADDATHRMANISSNATGTANYILNEALVNKSGEEIGKSFKTIFKDLPNKKMTTPSGKVVDAETALNDYMLHQHNRSSNSMVDDVLKNDTVTDSTVNKRIFKEDITPEMSDRIVKDYESRHPELKKVASNLRESYDKFMQEWAVNGDLVSQDLYNTIKASHPDYVPKNRYFTELEKLDPKYNPTSGFVGNKKVINRFEGSKRDIVNPISSLIGNKQRIISAVRGNEVGLQLLNSIRNGTLKKANIAEIVPNKQGVLDEINSIIDEHGVEGLTDYIGAQFDKAVSKNLKGSNIVTVMEKGVPVQIKINDINLLKAIRGITESSQGTIEKLGRTITAPFKATITGLNPIFAVKNLSRDIPTAYINSIISNPFKFSADMVIAAKEMATGGKYWKEYKALGGEHGNFLNDGGNKLTNMKNKIVKGENVLQKVGDRYKKTINSTESVNRFAEYMRTVKAGGNTYESKLQGLANAQEVSTNFGRHGNVTKAIDSWVPYLNPAVQGLDKFGRQFITKPVKTTLKSLLAVSVPTAIMYNINKDNPNYEALDNRTKDMNYLIPREDGTFTKIPKNRDTGALFGTLLERIIRMQKGEVNAFKDYDKTLKTNFLPPNPLDSNIASPIINLPSNKDFAGRSIEPLYMQDRNKRDMYNDKTSNIAKSVAPLAEKIGLSPMQVDYLIKSYTGIIAQVGLPATTEDADWGKVVGGGFKADPLYNNQSVQDFYENKDKLTKISGSKNFTENIPSKTVTNEEMFKNAFNRASTHVSDIAKKINTLKNPDDIKLLRKELITITDNMNKAFEKNDIKALNIAESKIKKLK